MSDETCSIVKDMSERYISVWYCFTSHVVQHTDRLIRLLSHEELNRYEQFVFSRHRQEFLAAHSMKRLVLSECSKLPPHKLTFSVDAHGKPTFVSSNGRAIGFNVSHTKEVAALAIANTRLIGIDVECSDVEIDIDVALEALSLLDATNVRLVDPDKRLRHFLRYWTAREAFSKAIGLGLSLPAEAVSFKVCAGSVPSLRTVDIKYGSPATWHLCQEWISGRHILTAAVKKEPGSRVRCSVGNFPALLSAALKAGII